MVNTCYKYWLTKKYYKNKKAYNFNTKKGAYNTRDAV